MRGVTIEDETRSLASIRRFKLISESCSIDAPASQRATVPFALFPADNGPIAHVLWNISRTFMRWNFRQAEELGRAAMLKPDTCGNMW